MMLFGGLLLLCLVFQGLVFVQAEISISIHELPFHTSGSLRGETTLQFNAPVRSVALTPGLSFGFRCTAPNHNPVPWSVNSTSVPQMDPDDVTGTSLVYYSAQGSDRILTFQYFNSTMSGNYSCTTASDKRTLVIREGIVTVLLEYQTYSQDTVVGNSVTLSIQLFYAGIPQPSTSNLTWFFNGDLLTDQLRTDLDVTITSTLFIMQGFSLSQEGVYLLNVTTSAGTGTASFYLDIMSRPSACFITPNDCLKQWDRVMSLNSSFVLNCTDESGDPLSKFEWFKDDINITAAANPQFSITQYTNRISYLTVTGVTSELAGSYKCATNNGIGKSQAIADVFVEFTPNVSRITPFNSSVPIGGSIKLLVHFIGGYPLPTATWYRLLGVTNESVPITDSRASASGQHSLNLTITDSALTDDGLYLLKINNTIGSIELHFNVTILVPPALSNLSSLVLFHRTADCAHFLVNISSAKPPVTSSLIQWSGSYQSDRSTVLLMNGVSNMTLCDLVTGDTGPVTMTVTHPAATNINITFDLTVWGPPLPPSNFTITRVSSCIVSLNWSTESQATPTSAPINNIILITSYCDSSFVHCTLEKEEIFPLNINKTRLHLSPYKEYTFSLLSMNDLIGRGISRNTNPYSTISDGSGFSPVVVSPNITANSSHLSISWFPPTHSSTCYNISYYSLDCYRGQVGGGRGVAPVYSTNITADVRRGRRIHVHVPVMFQDARYDCLINVLVSDVTGGVYSLTTPTNISINTLPAVPPQPTTPTFSRPTEADKAHTVTIDLSVFRPSLHNVGILRIGVLRLGSSPTLPSRSPDSLYTSDQSFTSYEGAHRHHQGGGPESKPYFAAELTIDSTGESFVVGSDSNDTSSSDIKKRQAIGVFTNGPLDDDSYYTFFIRAYSYSQYGSQYEIYTTTSFTSPVKPVSGTSPTTDGPTTDRREGGASVGIAVGVVFFILFLIAVAVAVLVVVFLLWRKSKRKASTTLSHVERDGTASPRNNQYTSHEEIKARAGSLSSKDSPVHSPVTTVPPVTNGPPVVIGSVPAATNPCYTPLEEEEEEVKRPPSDDGEPFSDDALSLSEFVRPPSTPSSLTPPGHVTMDTCISMDTSVVSNGAAANGSYSPSDFKPGEHVGREEFQEYSEKLDKNKQEIFNEIFEFINSSSPNYVCAASVAAHEYDHNKNRYRDVGAFDQTRVTLQEIPGVPHSDYINANYIKGYYDDKLYIGTQGPKEETTNDFWRMVWEQRTVTIVMLTNLIESGRSKCHQYWPSSGQCCYGDIVVRVDRNIELPHYTIRGFKVFNRDMTEKERTVLQFHYTAWPDRNVPAQASHVLDFLRAVNSANDNKEYGPVVVHCSAGVGRTGTIIALDIALEQLKSENKVDIKGIVTFLRKQRKQMVQAVCQYIFIHNAILEDIVYGDTAVTIDEFKDRYMKLQEAATLINEEFNKIGSVKPPAQACPGPSIVPYESGDDSKFTAYYLDGYWTPNLFIKSPCPTKDNEEHFWRLIMENKCTHIINLSPADTTTYSYIPPDVGDKELKFGSLTVSVGRRQFNAGFSTRDITILNEEDSSLLKLKHIQYQEMLLKQCFPRSDKFIKFIQGCLVEAESCHRGNHPILIHDDGSNGPVGIFATLAYCLQRARKERIIDLLQSVNHHYLQCPGLIVNLQFYAYCYDCLLEYSEKLLKEESLPPIYENIASIRGKLVPSPEPLDEKHKEVMDLGYDIL